MEFSEEVGGELVVAGGEATAVLETAQHALDSVAAPVVAFAEAAFPASVALGRDVGDRALLLDQIADAVAVIGPVGMDDAARRQPVQQMPGPASAGRRAVDPSRR